MLFNVGVSSVFYVVFRFRFLALVGFEYIGQISAEKHIDILEEPERVNINASREWVYNTGDGRARAYFT
jgi:hypothetical protein